MIREMDVVALTDAIPAHQLEAGDTGTVVLIHDGGVGFEVEFTTLLGETVAVVTVGAESVRPVNEREISHARALAG